MSRYCIGCKVELNDKNTDCNKAKICKICWLKRQPKEVIERMKNQAIEFQIIGRQARGCFNECQCDRCVEQENETKKIIEDLNKFCT